MFDFTDDLSDFFKEIVDWFNWFVSGTKVVADGATDAFEELQDLLKVLPVGIRSVILATFSVWIFFLFRNGKGG